MYEPSDAVLGGVSIDTNPLLGVRGDMIQNLTTGVRAFTSNAFLVTGSRTVLVDTGANFDVVDRIRDTTDTLDAVVLTHTHSDHVGNVAPVTGAFDVDVWGFDPENEHVDNAIHDEATVTMGDHEYLALHTPGHKNDHLCFYAATPKVIFTGDLVFQNGSFGRTDLPEGNRDQLIASIDRVLDVVDPSLEELHCGHGPSVTRNPYEDIELARQIAEQF